MQGFDHYRAMSQEGVAASQADLVVISADGLKGMGGESGQQMANEGRAHQGNCSAFFRSSRIACGVRGPKPSRAISSIASSCLWRPAGVALTLYATTLGAMRLPLVNLLPSGDEILRHIWLTIRLPGIYRANSAGTLSGNTSQQATASAAPLLMPSSPGSAPPPSAQCDCHWSTCCPPAMKSCAISG
jgi:hypothetical protein